MSAFSHYLALSAYSHFISFISTENDPKPNEERINLFVEEAKLWADRVLSIAESDHLLAEKVWIPFYFGLSSTAEEASVADDVVADDVEKKTITQQMNAVELK